MDGFRVRLRLDERKVGEERKWEERKQGGRKTGKENVIPYVAWMDEGKHRGKKMGKYQNI